MKNVASFETARKLKESGFPQLEPEAGQVWYTNGGIALIITASSEGRCDYVVTGCSAVYLDRFLDEEMVFAPTATDIFEKLPTGFWTLEKGNNLWHVTINTFERFLASDKDIAEAAADAWLSIHKKKDLEK